MARRVGVFIWIIVAIRIPVKGLSVKRFGDHGVCLCESAAFGVVVAGAVVIELGPFVPHLPGVLVPVFAEAALVGNVVDGDLAERQVVDAFVDVAVCVGHHPGGAEMVGKTGCAASIGPGSLGAQSLDHGLHDFVKGRVIFGN